MGSDYIVLQRMLSGIRLQQLLISQSEWELSSSRLDSQWIQQQLIVTYKATCPDHIRLLNIEIIKCLRKKKYIPYFTIPVVILLQTLN